MAQPSPTTRISVAVKGNSGEGVASQLTLSLAAGSPRVPTLGDGTGSFDLGSCAAPVQLYVIPVPFGYTGTSSIVSCGNRSVTVEVERNARYGALEPAYGDLATPAHADPQVAALRQQLAAALESGASAEAAELAGRLAATYRLRDPTLAVSYQSLATEAAQRSLAPDRLQLDMTDHLRLDPNGRLIILTPSGRRDLQRFQRQYDLPETGRWDTQSIQAIRDRGERPDPAG